MLKNYFALILIDLENKRNKKSYFKIFKYYLKKKKTSFFSSFKKYRLRIFKTFRQT